MKERSAITPPIKPDTLEQVSALRTVAIVTASIALAGFVVWCALGETHPTSVASIAGDGEARRLFSEKNRELYVAPPPNAVETRKVAPLSSDALATLAALPPSRRKPTPAPLLSMPPAPPAPAHPALDDTTATEPPRSAPTLDETPAYSARDASSPADERWTDEAKTDEPSWHEPSYEAPPGDPSWDEPSSGEPGEDEPPPDDQYGPEEPS